MRLGSAAFAELSTALADAFADEEEFRLLARSLDIQLQDIVGEGAVRGTIIRSLIEYAERSDRVEDLIRCAQEQRPTNKKLAALDFSQLEEARSTDEVVEAGAGAPGFKDRLREAIGALDIPGQQLVAARDIATLLGTASNEEAETIYLTLLGSVKTDRPDEVVAALTPIVASSLRRSAETRDASQPLDLSRARLRRIDLSGLDLHAADIAFADLRHANLENTNLWRSRGYGVDVTKAGLSRSNLEEARWHSALAKQARFHDCRMTSVFLKNADLERAEFQRSRLQGAHFEGANLKGALFEQANLADATFTGVTIDDAAAASIARAENWRKARFDPATLALIEQHEAG